MKTIALKDLAKELGDFYGRTQEQSKKCVRRGLERSLITLSQNSPVDTGLYASSWDFQMDEKQAILGNYAPYAGIVEHGTRPFRPPLGPLLRWAKRVLKSPSQPPQFEPKVWALALYTQKKIEQHGIAPRHVLENSMPEIIENIRLEFKRG